MGPNLCTHLHAPPPVSSLHVMIHVLLLVLIYVVLLWLEHQHWGKIWVSKQGVNAGNDVSVVYFIYLVVGQDFMMLKQGPPW